MIVALSVLLLVFAAVIVLLSMFILRQRTKERSKLTAIPKILERRAINNATRDAEIKRRPKSTNLEFLHSTNDNRYNNAITRGDPDCIKPLVESSHQDNEYMKC